MAADPSVIRTVSKQLAAEATDNRSDSKFSKSSVLAERVGVDALGTQGFLVLLCVVPSSTVLSVSIRYRPIHQYGSIHR